MPLTAEYLRECFDYDPRTGDTTWRERPRRHFSSDQRHKAWNKRFAGQPMTGTPCGKGHNLSLDGITHRKAALIWTWMTDDPTPPRLYTYPDMPEYSWASFKPVERSYVNDVPSSGVSFSQKRLIEEAIQAYAISERLVWRERPNHHFPSARKAHFWNRRHAGAEITASTVELGSRRYSRSALLQILEVPPVPEPPEAGKRRPTQRPLPKNHGSEAWLRELSTYDPATGAMSFLTRPPEHFPTTAKHDEWNAEHAGQAIHPEVGPQGRWRVRIDGVFYPLEQIASAHLRRPVEQLDRSSPDFRESNLVAPKTKTKTKEQSA